MQIEIGKKYEDKSGLVVEIIGRSDRPDHSSREFVGLLDTGENKVFRFFGSAGMSSCGLLKLAREYAPVTLEVGKAYARRDGTGYGVVIHEEREKYFALVTSPADGHFLMSYNADGTNYINEVEGVDLVPGPVFAPGSSFGYEPFAAAAVAGILAQLMSGEERISDVVVDHSSAIRTLTGFRFEIRQGMGR